VSSSLQGSFAQLRYSCVPVNNAVKAVGTCPQTSHYPYVGRNVDVPSPVRGLS